MMCFRRRAQRCGTLAAIRAWPFALLAGLLLFGCSGGEDESAGARGTPPGGTLANFTLPDLDGNPVRLADFRGKTVVLDFWATWCPPCVFQIPELNKFCEAHKDTGDVVVIGVSVDAEGAEVVAPWAEEQGVTYTLVIGDENLAQDFGAMGFPTLVIVAPDGRIHSRHVGLIEVDELESLVDAIPAARST